jgi:hypothetical protein
MSIDNTTTDVIRLRRSKVYDLIFVMVVAAIVLLVVLPALVPLVKAFKGECQPTPIQKPVPRVATK